MKRARANCLTDIQKDWALKRLSVTFDLNKATGKNA